MAAHHPAEAVVAMPASRTGAAFVDFFHDLFVSPDEATRVAEWANSVADTIRNLVPVDRDLPGPVEAVVRFGSSVRGTAFRPINEVDLAVVFKVPAIAAAMPLYNPDSLVGLLSTRLSVHAERTTSWTGQVVTLSAQGKPDLDVFPAFVDDMLTRNRTAMWFPRQNTSWFRTNPVALDRLFLARNAEVDGRLIPTALLVKAWNRKRGNLLPSWILDTVLLYNSRRLTGRHNVDVYAFLDGIAKYFDRVMDVASADGFIEDVSGMIPSGVRDAVISAARDDASQALVALTAESVGDDSTAIANWHAVLARRVQ